MDPGQFVRSLEKKHKSLTHLCVFSFLKSHPFIIMVCLSCGGNIQFTCPHSNQVSDAKNCTHTASELRVGVDLRQTCRQRTGLNNYLFISDHQVDTIMQHSCLSMPSHTCVATICSRTAFFLCSDLPDPGPPPWNESSVQPFLLALLLVSKQLK